MDTSQLTFTRFIAAVLIIIYHFANGVFPFNVPIITIIVGNLNLAVSYFFLLSGFVMTVAYGKRGKQINYSSFVRNRIARILPLYFLAMLVMLVYYYIRINILSMPANYKPKVIDVLLNTLLLQSWVPGKATTVNVAAWSLSVEWFFYLLFPLLYNKIYSKFSLKIMTVLALIVVVVSQLLLHYMVSAHPALSEYWYYHPLFHVNVFIAGNVTGFYFLKGIKMKSIYLSLILILAVTAIAIIQRLAPALILSNGIYLVVFIPFLILMVHSQMPVINLFKKRSMQYLGEISFGMYILQFPLYFFFTAFLTVIGFKINDILFYVYLIVLMFVSAFSYNFVESPLREKIKRIKRVHNIDPKVLS